MAALCLALSVFLKLYHWKKKNIMCVQMSRKAHLGCRLVKVQLSLPYDSTHQRTNVQVGIRSQEHLHMAMQMGVEIYMYTFTSKPYKVEKHYAYFANEQ